jgi:UDP-GlcNAc3NAcA epimerase
MKILSVAGARPQFIKTAVVLSAFKQLNKVKDTRFHSILVHTGQHYDFNMSDLFFEELAIPEPDYNLGIGSGLHGEQTGKMLDALEKVYLNERPDLVLVYGDTNSTLAGALAAAKLHIPVGHVEAGLRSYNRKMPEEMNRVLTDHISDILFCPSDTACKNLEGEGFKHIVNDGLLLPRDSEFTNSGDPLVLNVGDVMVDAMQRVMPNLTGVAEHSSLSKRGYIVLTLHRAENVDSEKRLAQILSAMTDSPLPIVFPVHPRTKARLSSFELGGLVERPPFISREPLGYEEMLGLVHDAALVLTDSGGLQKEAFLLGVPCITLRTETEWVETVEAGWNTLIPYPKKGFINDRLHWAEEVRLLEQPKPYGDGAAGYRIVKFLNACSFSQGER